MIVVSDASPLIALGRIQKIELLKDLFGNIIIPGAVLEEVVKAGDYLPGAAKVAAADWIKSMSVRNRTIVEIYREKLDAGESEAIVLVFETDADLLLIDEAKGRRIAEIRKINTIGTLGCLVLAKKRGLIPSVKPLLEALSISGFRMDEKLYQRALSLALETS